jgi:hypothetical protein
MPYINIGKGNSSDIQLYYKNSDSDQAVVFSGGCLLRIVAILRFRPA